MSWAMKLPLAQGGGSPNSHHSVTMDSPLVLTQHISNTKVELGIQERVRMAKGGRSNHRGCHTIVMVVSVILFMLGMDPMVHCSSESKEEESIKHHWALHMSQLKVEKFLGMHQIERESLGGA